MIHMMDWCSPSLPMRALIAAAGGLTVKYVGLDQVFANAIPATPLTPAITLGPNVHYALGGLLADSVCQGRGTLNMGYDLGMTLAGPMLAGLAAASAL